MGLILGTQGLRPDNSIPILVGCRYQIGNSVMGGQWVVVVSATSTHVHAVGVDNNHADITLPRWRFDDVVCDFFIP